MIILNYVDLTSLFNIYLFMINLTYGLVL